MRIYANSGFIVSSQHRKIKSYQPCLVHNEKRGFGAAFNFVYIADIKLVSNFCLEILPV